MHDLHLRKAQTALQQTTPGPKNQVHFSLYRALAVCTSAHLLSGIGRNKYFRATDRNHDMEMDGGVEETNESAEVKCDGCPVPVGRVVHEHTQLACWLNDPYSSAGFFGSKMMSFVSLCAHQMSQDPTRKMILFANYSSSLRLAADALLFHYPIYQQATRFLTGDVVSSTARERILSEFRHSPSVHFLFMTLKLGGTGLNLTEADTVIFLENWYCDAVLQQAQCRVHRIGQQRPVEVFYFVAKDTVEERMINIAKEKQVMSETILGKPFHEKMDWSQMARDAK
jgi:SNF2 family DNA or RNA helicase